MSAPAAQEVVTFVTTTAGEPMDAAATTTTTVVVAEAPVAGAIQQQTETVTFVTPDQHPQQQQLEPVAMTTTTLTQEELQQQQQQIQQQQQVEGIPEGMTVVYEFKNSELDIEDFYHTDLFSDVTLSGKDGSLRAHQMVLASVSTYLKKIFLDLPTPNEECVLIFPDYTINEIHSFVKILYGFDRDNELRSAKAAKIIKTCRCNFVIAYKMPSSYGLGDDMQLEQPATDDDLACVDGESITDRLILPVDPDDPSKCVMCSYRTEETRNLRRHYHQTHQKRVCPYCSKTYAMNFIQQHIATKHTKQLNYKCDQCEQAFFTRKRLEDHKEVTHVQVMSYGCDVCGKGFFSKMQLKRHRVRRHNGEQQQFACQHCDKVYLSKYSLKKHLEHHHQSNQQQQHQQQHQQHVDTTSFRTQEVTIVELNAGETF